MTQPIRLARPDVGEAELAAVAEVVRTGQLTMGPKVEEFEAGIARPSARRTRLRSRPARPRSISPCSRSRSGQATR